MSRSSLQLIEEHLKTWRISTNDRLRKLPGLAISDPHLGQSLLRLRRRGKLQSVKVGREWFHFDISMKRRAEALQRLSPLDRVIHFLAWGMEHHLAVIDLGLKFEREFPELQVTPNLFSEHLSYTVGSFGLQGKKFAPDLTLAKDDCSKGITYIEVERTLKSASRYQERWLAYESDVHVSNCLYFMSDRSLAERVKRFMARYLLDSRARKDFTLGVIVQEKALSLKNAPVFLFSNSRTADTISLNDLLRENSQKIQIQGGRS